MGLKRRRTEGGTISWKRGGLTLAYGLLLSGDLAMALDRRSLRMGGHGTEERREALEAGPANASNKTCIDMLAQCGGMGFLAVGGKTGCCDNLVCTDVDVFSSL